MVDRFKAYVTWFFIHFIAFTALLSVIPLGINGESCLEIGFPAMWWVMAFACAWTNLIHFFTPTKS